MTAPAAWLGAALRAATRVAAGAFVLALLWPAARTPLDGAGAAVLLAAPFVVTILAAVAYARRNRRVALLAGLLLLVLAAGAWLGARGLGT